MEDLKLTVKDKKILQGLDLDARQSNSQLAKGIRLSKNIVNYQIKRLEGLGVIKKHLTIIDYSKLGYLLFRVYLNFYENDTPKEKELVDYLIKDKKVGMVARTIGDWDLIYTYFVKDIQEFSQEWDRFTDKFRSVVKEYNTHLVTREYSYPRNYIVGDKNEPKKVWSRGGNTPEEKLDEVDLQILKLLLEDARVPIKDIAIKTGLGSMAIIYRFRQLAKKEVILGYRAELDFSKLGYEYYKVFLELGDTKILKELQGYCKASPYIVSVTKTISDNDDFEFDLEVKNFNDFLHMIDNLKKQFPKAIRDYRYIKVLEMHKQVHLPI